MYRLSKIPKKYKPKKLFSSSDKQLYTLKCQDWEGKEFPRKEARERGDASALATSHAAPAAADAAATTALVAATAAAWEGNYSYPIFQKIIDENIPCLIISTCKIEWCSEVNMVVQFMTGNLDDIFLVHPEDLKLWDPDEEFPHV